MQLCALLGMEGAGPTFPGAAIAHAVANDEIMGFATQQYSDGRGPRSLGVIKWSLHSSF